MEAICSFLEGVDPRGDDLFEMLGEIRPIGTVCRCCHSFWLGVSHRMFVHVAVRFADGETEVWSSAPSSMLVTQTLQLISGFGTEGIKLPVL